MNRIAELINENKKLRFLDVELQQDFSVHELNQQTQDTGLEKERTIVFLYLDNSIGSVATLLHFLNTSHVLTLLNQKQHVLMKQELEKRYQPGIIYDSERETIDGYSEHNWVFSGRIFYQDSIRTHLHPDIRLLLSTSGTTGSPKFVKLSEANILANALSIASYLPILTSDSVPLNLPIYYSYGLSVLTSNSIRARRIICTNKDILQKSFWDDFEAYGCATIAGVPFVYEMLNKIGFMKKEYPSLRYFTQAGGKLNDKLVEAFATYAKDKGKLFYVMYGQTEATARMSYLAPEMTLKKVGSIGGPIPNGRFEIDPETSELVYEGANVFGGYAEKPEDLASFSPLPKLHTGDLARMDEDGYFYITGRLKRFVKLFGNRINLDEVEQILKNKFSGMVFVSLGLADHYLVVVYQMDQNSDESVIRTFLSERLKLHPSSIRLKAVQSIPLTQNGKPDYPAMINTITQLN